MRLYIFKTVIVLSITVLFFPVNKKFREDLVDNNRVFDFKMDLVIVMPRAKQINKIQKFFSHNTPATPISI